MHLPLLHTVVRIRSNKAHGARANERKKKREGKSHRLCCICAKEKQRDTQIGYTVREEQKNRVQRTCNCMRVSVYYIFDGSCLPLHIAALYNTYTSVSVKYRQNVYYTLCTTPPLLYSYMLIRCIDADNATLYFERICSSLSEKSLRFVL